MAPPIPQKYAAKTCGLTSLQIAVIAGVCRLHGISLVSHDDATEQHVPDMVCDGIRFAEFPNAVEAARAAREHGLRVLMGGPNEVRRFSHFDDLSARDLALDGLLDTLSSGYLPSYLLHGAFVVHQELNAIDLSEAIAMVASNPADAAGLNDRGSIAPGIRADLVRVATVEQMPVVREVWRQGERVV